MIPTAGTTTTDLPRFSQLSAQLPTGTAQGAGESRSQHGEQRGAQLSRRALIPRLTSAVGGGSGGSTTRRLKSPSKAGRSPPRRRVFAVLAAVVAASGTSSSHCERMERGRDGEREWRREKVTTGRDRQPADHIAPSDHEHWTLDLIDGRQMGANRVAFSTQ